jgi:Fe-S cluster assembly iron-binding protein IscA
MLTVTDAAAQAIRSLVTKHKMPEGSGLRISRQGGGTRSEGLGISVVAAPAEDEAVVEANGAKIFLPPNMIKVLHDQELDVELVHEGDEEQPHFTVDRRRSKSHDSGMRGPAHLQTSDPEQILKALESPNSADDQTA